MFQNLFEYCKRNAEMIPIQRRGDALILITADEKLTLYDVAFIRVEKCI